MLTDRFEEALVYAFRLHRGQRRKASNIPYVSHLMSVAALVMENGGDEEQAIAALLHDAVEDQGGSPTLEAIRARFGERVAAIVNGCTDAIDHQALPSAQRKEIYLAHLPTVPAEVRFVALADKVHNARSIVSDLRNLGGRADLRCGLAALQRQEGRHPGLLPPPGGNF